MIFNAKKCNRHTFTLYYSLFSVDTTLFVTRQLEQSVIDVFEWLVTEKVHLQTIQLGGE